jgi:hypothetical protein
MARYIPANASDEPGTYAYDIPEVAGYTWTPNRFLNYSNENGEDRPLGEWIRNVDDTGRATFDASTLTQGNVDKYGRVSTLPRDNLTEGEKLAYILNYGEPNGTGLNMQDPELGKGNAMFGFAENYGNQNYWNMSAAEERAERDRVARYVASTRPSGFESGMSDFMTEKGYMIPLAMIGAGAATGAFGAAAGAAEGAGGFGLTASDVPSLAGGLSLDALPASTAIGGYGSIAAPSLAGGLALDGGLAGAGSMAGDVGFGLTASQVPSLAGNLGNLAIPEGLTGAEALKYANQARQGLNTANQLSKLLGGTTTKPAASGSGQQLASLLSGGGQSNSFIGQIKGNQNPFIFNTAGQTTAAPGTYDVSGMANALRKA